MVTTLLPQEKGKFWADGKNLVSEDERFFMNLFRHVFNDAAAPK
jgi:hypothetical protein